MNLRNRHALSVTLTASVFLSVMSTLAAAADVSSTTRPPSWTWAGLYAGGQIGGFGGSATFSDPQGPSIFGDKVNTSGFLAGLQLGYDWRVNSRWVLGVVADANYLDGKGTFTCMQASPTLIGSNCEVDPRVLTTVAGRLGYVLDPLGRTLLYGKAGGAWTNSNVSVHPNDSSGLNKFNNYMAPGLPTDASAGAWGGMVGVGLEHALTPAWSIGFEYDYYRFAATNVATPLTTNITRSMTPAFTDVAGSTSGVTQDMQIVKLALNYHFGRDPWAAWPDAPILPIGAFRNRASPVAVWNGWQLDAGTRYWYSTGSSTNTSGAGSLVSRLPYTNLTGQSGEFFARIDTPSEVFVKGFVGAGAITGGKMNDEDWGINDGPRTAPPIATAYEVTGSSASGWLKYGAADVGYNVFHNANYKVGPFVGYSYFHQTMNGIGCTQLTTPGSVCDPPDPPNLAIISQDDTWQALRVGASAIATVWDRLAINGDVAYLPYAQFSGLDTHWQRQPIAFYPQDGTGRGIQTELSLTYALTDYLNVGVGGRYWAMWSTSTSQSCHGGCSLSTTGPSVSPPGPFTTNTQRYGTFLQISYRFNARP
jgi:opacity protein-like surface antigen